MTGCIVQGNIRPGTDLVLRQMATKFDVVVLSTWEGQRDLPIGPWHVLMNELPPNPGIGNRNLQRISSAAGVDWLRRMGCDYVLKWRTDMLPTTLDLSLLMHLARDRVPPGLRSRVVTCAFRNLTVSPDDFSSMPDLFAFGHVDMLGLLWNVSGFDFTRDFNVPVGVDPGPWFTIGPPETVYCTETEVYVYFREALSEIVGRRLHHAEIAKDYMALIDHRRLRIVWFGPNDTFRSITQAVEYPWWNERTWKRGKPVVFVPGYPANHFWWQRCARVFNTWAVAREQRRGRRWYAQFARRGISGRPE